MPVSNGYRISQPFQYSDSGGDVETGFLWNVGYVENGTRPRRT
jgi:hypothetical protein